MIEERKNLTQKLHKLQPFDCKINDRQHEELLQLVSGIQSTRKGSASVNQLIYEAEQVLGTDNNVLRDAWQQDVLERLHFDEDQRKSGMVVHYNNNANFDCCLLSERTKGKQMESNYHQDGLVCE